MSMLEKSALAAALAVGLSLANAADAPRFGQPIAPGDLAPWDISIAPDGVGLPPGSGTPAQGAIVYAERGCALCHGEKGSGGPSGPLVGGGPLNSTDRTMLEYPVIAIRAQTLTPKQQATFSRQLGQLESQDRTT